MNAPEKAIFPHLGLLHPDFELLVQRIIQNVDGEQLAELRRDFHTRLRMTLTHPNDAELIEDLWDYFYDWCVFEQKLPDNMDQLADNDHAVWEKMKSKNRRGLYSVQKIVGEKAKIKDLYNGRQCWVIKREKNDFLGITRGDIVEARLVISEKAENDEEFAFLRRPSYHPAEVHNYVKKKVKQFRKTQDFLTYQSWLWLLVGMHLKHRIYHQMPIEKIYDDNSRI